MCRSASSIRSSSSPDDPRSAGAQSDLDAVAGDVGIEEADVVSLDGRLDEADDLVEPPRGELESLRRDRSSSPPKWRKAIARRAMFGRRRSAAQMRADRDGEEALDHCLGRMGNPTGGIHSQGAGARPSRKPGPVRAPTELRGSSRAVSGLTRI